MPAPPKTPALRGLNVFASRLSATVLLSAALASCGGSDGPTGPGDPPGAPTNVQVVPVGSGSLTISWDPVAGASSYTVYMASQPGVGKSNYAGRPEGARLQNVNSPSQITGLSGRTYYLVVTASNAGGESIESEEVSGTPDVQLSPLADAQLEGGSYAFTSMHIPVGVTLTITGPVEIAVGGNASIDGTVVADCHALELRVGGALTLDGLLTNACAVPPGTGGPDLMVLADGALTIGTEVSNQDGLVSDGSIRLTDSATENETFVPIFDSEASPPAGGAASGPAQQVGGSPATVNRPVRAGRGGSVRQSRDGDVNINADVTAMSGLGAAVRADAPVCDNTSAVGGTGGSVYLSSRSGTLAIADDVTVAAGDGGKGGDCIANPVGAEAQATAGPGGRGGGVYVGGQRVTFGTDVILRRGDGGRGGDAIANGGDGQLPCEDGYAATATGGVGGPGGGIGYVVVDPAQIVGTPTEQGAVGGKGGTGTALGGDGADCVCGMGDGVGGDGGAGTALGGKGGDGATGNIWPLGFGALKKGDGGNAEAFGGNGGAGADCCTTKVPGGDGGAGGNAAANGGPIGDEGAGGDGNTGRADSVGGDGGGGGDGLGGGSGGAPGSATSTGDPESEQDGDPGAAGGFCADLLIWSFFLGVIPDGLITPGSDILLPIFDKTQTNQTGSALAHFQTAGEAGENSVQYSTLNEFMAVIRGGIQFNLGTVVPGFPVAIVTAFVDLLCTEENCAELVGYYQGAEVARVGNREVLTMEDQQQLLELPAPPPGVPYYDAFELESHGGFWIHDWNLKLVDP